MPLVGKVARLIKPVAIPHRYPRLQQTSCLVICGSGVMSYLLIFAGLLGLTLYMDLGFALGAGIILTAETIWAILLNRKVPIPKW